MRLTSLAIAVALAALPIAAHAQTAAPAPAAAKADVKAARKAMRDACAGDIQKHCASMPKGKGELQKCLQSHAAELTPACTTARTALQAARKS